MACLSAVRLGHAFAAGIIPLAACGGSPTGADAKTNTDAGARTDVPPNSGGDAGGEPLPARGHGVLFVGNSYVFVNDVSGHYRAIASALSSGVRVEEVTTGGYRLEQHATDARTDGTPLARWLRTGTAEETSFDAVVLQEQSQIGGFPTAEKARVASVAAATELTTLARARGAAVVLYMTWGYERGDASLSLLGYNTYSGMQDRLDDGYLGLASRLREDGTDVRVAPVGGGFRIVFEDLTRGGGDPLAKGSDFDALYEPDGSHPSLRGAYLAACIIAGTINTADVRGFIDEPALGAEVSGRLRDVCARALADPRWHVASVRRPQTALVGDSEPYTRFGSSVALSADGATAIVGAVGGGMPAGSSARAFVRGAAGWTEEALWRDGVLGSSVALSADGTRAIVSGAGLSARVHARTGATWAAEPTVLALRPGVACSNTELALSADGQRVVVGGSRCWPASSESVTVMPGVFAESGSTWVEQSGLSSDLEGPSVALDSVGTRALVAAGGSALAHVFAHTAAGWADEATLPSSVPSTGRRVVGLSANGERAVVGLPGESRAVTFVRSGTTWTEEATLRGPTVSHLGGAIALSADGRRVVLGLPGDSPATTGLASGSARVYALHDGAFEAELLLVPRDGSVAAQFGTSVAMSPDGKNVVVGAPHASSDGGNTPSTGKAYAFTLP